MPSFISIINVLKIATTVNWMIFKITGSLFEANMPIEIICPANRKAHIRVKKSPEFTVRLSPSDNNASPISARNADNIDQKPGSSLEIKIYIKGTITT